MVEESICQCRRQQPVSWVGKISWRTNGNPLQYCLKTPVAWAVSPEPMERPKTHMTEAKHLHTQWYIVDSEVNFCNLLHFFFL